VLNIRVTLSTSYIHSAVDKVIVEVIKNTPLAVNFATLYLSGKVISKFFFKWVMILLYMFYRLGDLKPPI
jgi:hypothetical protein